MEQMSELLTLQAKHRCSSVPPVQRFASIALVETSYIEIYNEKIVDLFDEENLHANQQKSLRKSPDQWDVGTSKAHAQRHLRSV